MFFSPTQFVERAIIKIIGRRLPSHIMDHVFSRSLGLCRLFSNDEISSIATLKLNLGCAVQYILTQETLSRRSIENEILENTFYLLIARIWATIRDSRGVQANI